MARRSGHPYVIEYAYEAVLLDYARKLVARSKAIAPATLSRVVLTPDQASRQDAAGDAPQETPSTALVRWVNRQLSTVQPPTTKQIVRFGKQTKDYADETLNQRGVPRVGPGVTLDTLREFTRINAELIESIALRQAQDVAGLATEALVRGLTGEDLAEAIQARINVPENNARRIARDQIGKLNGQITATRSAAAGLKQYVWSDSDDIRVRPLHRRLNGQIFDIAHGHPTEGNPGEAILCRCTMLPVFNAADAARVIAAVTTGGDIPRYNVGPEPPGGVPFPHPSRPGGPRPGPGVYVNRPVRPAHMKAEKPAVVRHVTTRPNPGGVRVQTVKQLRSPVPGISVYVRTTITGDD